MTELKKPQNNISSVNFDDEVDLIKLFKIIMDGKKVIISGFILSALISILYSLSLTNYYLSESILSIRDNSQASSISQYSGAAAMLGVNLPASGENKTMEVIELVQSRKFVEHLLTFENTLPSIMAAERFNGNTNKLIFDLEKYDPSTGTWKMRSDDLPQVPSYLEVHEVYNKELLKINHDIQTGFIKLSVEHISPFFAKQFLDLIINEANTLLRKKDLELSSQAIDFLESQLSQTSFTEIRKSINTLIESQLETQMMAKIYQDYILETIDPPFVPEKKSKPSRSIIVIVSSVLGTSLAILIVIVRYFLSFKENLDTN